MLSVGLSFRLTRLAAPKCLRQHLRQNLGIRTLTHTSQRLERLLTVPNTLTLTRIISTPILGYLIVNDHHNWALGLFAYSCVTDFFDGWIARKYNLGTALGSILDPFADKLLMVTFTGCLWYTAAIPAWIAGIIFGRDLLLSLSAFYIRYISLPAPKTFKRYWDLSIPSVQVTPSTISKWNTGFQMVYLALAFINQTHFAPLFLSDVVTCGGYLVATTTTWSGLDYLLNRNAVKFIK